MNIDTFYTYNEIKTQIEAWVQAIDVAYAVPLPDAAKFAQVIFTGCGSTYYLSLAAAAMYQELTGRAARAVPASELLLNPQTVMQDNISNLLVAISRSGMTTETIKAVEKFKHDRRGEVVAISNYEEALSRLASTSIVIDKGQEKSIAQTRSFASMFVAITMFCARLARRDDLLSSMNELPAVGRRVISKYEAFAKEIGTNMDFDKFYFLGSGIRYGLACEANLKMKEMALTHSEPFHFLEFRHGPMSMVNDKAVVIGLLSRLNCTHEAKVLSEMEALGATVVSLGETDTRVAFESGIPEPASGVLYLPVLQLMAFYRSVVKGLNPDCPNNLAAVVKLI